MKNSLLFTCTIAAFFVVCQGSSALAGPNWRSFVPFYRVEADESKSYELTEKDGPWLIMAAAFQGDNAQEQAHDLVIELRKRYGWKAYIAKQNYDFTGEVDALGITPDRQPKKLPYRRNLAYTSYAVLVGDFESVYGQDAKSVLEKVKLAHPDTLNPNKRPVSMPLRNWREIQRKLTLREEIKQTGPMRKAFITRNPLIPEEFFAPKGLDPLVARMNDGADYSLLKNPGRYTVKVATFRGNVAIGNLTPDEEAKWNTSGGTSKLALAAVRAHGLTMELRKRGVEAYQFHDRHESIVTVGSFSSVGTPRPDGKTEIDAGVHRIMKSYGADTVAIGGGQQGFQPNSLAGYPFDVQPVPIEVPRVSVARDYAQGGSLFE